MKITRIVHLLPQDTTLDELDAVTSYLHQSRNTFTYSADDAADLVSIGSGDSHVQIWDSQRWSGDIDSWFSERGINVIHRKFSELGVVSPAPIPPPGSGDYTGPIVSFVAGIDQPASSWDWIRVKSIFDDTGLFPKFHTSGNSHDWFFRYRHPSFNLIRAILPPSFSDPDPASIWAMLSGEIAKYWQFGAFDFELLNEPNIPQENLGKLWNNGGEFGNTFRELCRLAKIDFPGIRIWFPGMSPGGGDETPPLAKPQHRFIADAMMAGAFDFIYGICCHAYTGILASPETAANRIVDDILGFRSLWAMDKPLAVTEFSVNRPETAAFKAKAYLDVCNSLRSVPGIQAAYSFAASWYGGQPDGEWGATWDLGLESWFELGIDGEYAKLI